MADLFQPEIVPSGRVPRPHQLRSIEMIRESLREGYRRVVLQLATGGGKTFIASEIIRMARAKNSTARVMFTVPLISLVDQTVQSFRSDGIDHIGVIQADHPGFDPYAPVQVASVQTLARRGRAEHADLVLVDECHIHSQGIEALMEANERAWFIGLSATPWRKGMGASWSKLLVGATVSELIEAGSLADFTLYQPDTPDMTGAPKSGGDYAEAYSAEVMSRPQIVGNIVQCWMAYGNAQPTLGFAVNCATGKHMAAVFERAGVSAGYIDAYTDEVERGLIVRRYLAGEIKVIWSVRTMTTGVDLPVGCIIDAAPTQSEMLHVQKTGRVLRVNPGLGGPDGRKIILDHAGNAHRLGMVTEIAHDDFVPGKRQEAEEREAREKLPKPCSKCGGLVPPKVKACPHCGHEPGTPPPVEMVDGTLVRVDRGGKSVATWDEKCLFWGMALSIDSARGKGGRLAKALYRERFGVWPKGLPDRPMAPDQGFLNYEKSRRIAFAKRMEKRRAG